MAVGNADIMQAINTLWDANNLDSGFTQYWNSIDIQNESVLLIGPLSFSPFPFCRAEAMRGRTRERMSAGKGFLREIRDVPVSFQVHVESFYTTDDGELVPIDFTGTSPAEIAESRIEEIIKVYGGHHTTDRQEPELDHGKVLVVQYQNDFISSVIEKDNFTGVIWELNYNFRVDVPVAI